MKSAQESHSPVALYGIPTQSLRVWGCFFLLAIMFVTVFAACSPQDIQQGGNGQTPTSPSTSTQVTIDASKPRATIPITAFGMNTAVWDNNLLDSGVSDLLRGAGVTMLRFPGGSTADVYHWSDNTVTGKKGYVNPNNNFDAFMGLVQQIGAQAFITVNYGSNNDGTGGGDPAEAAAWVHYANIVKHYGVKYWEIGNEVYGNGSYSAGKWEADLHSAKGPDAYAQNVLAFVQAMKAVDPTIKVGISLTTPVLDSKQDAMSSWNPTVLSTTCSQIDFVDVHWYPRWQNHGDGSGPDEQLLDSTRHTADLISQPRSQITQNCGTHAKDVQIMLGEVNSGNQGKQSVSLVNALFLSDAYMSWLENGATNVSWWDLHEGVGTDGKNDSSVYGSTSYGDNGILSNNTCKNGQCEPEANTPFPPYYGLQMLAHLGLPGDQIVTAVSKNSAIAAHAVKQANGNLAVLLINKDPSANITPTISLVGYHAASSATTYSYGMNSANITSGTANGVSATFRQLLSPYSLTTIVFSPTRAHIPGSTPPLRQSGAPLAMAFRENRGVLAS